MRIVTFEHDGRTRPGLLDGHEVVDLDGLPPVERLLAEPAFETLLARRARDARRLALARVRLCAPLMPRRMIGTGTNYRSHVAEMGSAPPREPSAWLKLPDALCGPGDPIVLPPDCRAVDYEAEIAVVIGVPLYRVDAAGAERAIAGLTLCDEVSARDLPMAQTVLAKGSPSFAPLGPALVTREDCALDDVAFTLHVNGIERQRGNSADLLFGLVELVRAYAALLPLAPGDVLLTGTPGGVGVGMTPPRMLAHGDEVTIASPQLGVLRNPVVAAEQS